MGTALSEHHKNNFHSQQNLQAHSADDEEFLSALIALPIFDPILED